MVTKEPCPKCGSSNNLARWPEGFAKCYTPSCGYTERAPGHPGSQPAEERATEETTKVSKLITGLLYVDIESRGLSKESCEKFNYGVKTLNERKAHIACYRDPKTGKITSQKVRYIKEKDFFVAGKAGHEMPLFGMHLWKPTENLFVVVTEGEIDAVTVSQVMGHKYPVVSIPNGSGGAPQSIKHHLEWLESFKHVVFMFDMDEAGRDATEKCCNLLTPGKAYVGELPLKDANECLLAGKADAIIRAAHNARPYRPDGILTGEQITLAQLKTPITGGVSTPYPGLDTKLRGLRRGEITLLTAGTGVGKSTLARELAYHLAVTHKQKVANLFLEESYLRTAAGYAALHHNVPLGDLVIDPTKLTDAQWLEAKEQVLDKRMFFFNHFGSLDSTTLLSRMNYMAVGLGVDYIMFDHISIATSGLESSKEGERKDIDILMTRLRSLVARTGVGVVAIVHLTKPEGKSAAYEEGGRVTLRSLRGSGSLGQIADNVIAIERDQQSDQSDVSYVRVLKNRLFGDLGPAQVLRYDKITGRLKVSGDVFADESSPSSTPGY